ncbi:MAG: hypothetical protein V5B30_11780 [Candidatus Accumulibacter delftensis]
MMTRLQRLFLTTLTVISALSLTGMANAAHGDVAAPNVPRPSDNAYVMVRDGHFFLADQRVRFWGFNIQSGVFSSYEEITQTVERLARLGVNAVRLWPTQGTFYERRSLPERRFPKVSIQDGSLLDRYDFFIAELKREGIFVQNPALHYLDVDAIRNWPDQEVRFILGRNPTDGDIRKLHGIAPYLSKGWEAMVTTHIRNYLAHLNPYTQRTNADEPVFSGWELANESQFVHCALRRACVAGLPFSLRAELKRRWQHYWSQRNVGSNVDLPVYESDWDRADNPAHAAYRQFVFEHFVTVSQRLESVARGMGTAGNGISVQPVTYSTQAGEPLLMARAAYSAGDYSAIGAYQTRTTANKEDEFFPFRLNLSFPIYYDFNYGSVQGKPTVVYENSFFRPYPYRAEWPWALLYLATVQDWDAAFLYAYGQPWAIYGDPVHGSPVYGEKPLPTPSDPQDSAPRGAYIGLHHGGDEVTIAAWSAAGLVFLGGELTSEAEPRVYEFTPLQKFGPAPGYCAGAQACGAGAREMMADMNVASLTGPVRLAWTEATKPIPAASGAQPGKIHSTALTLNRALPQLLIDTPRNKVVAGFLEGRVQFQGGISVKFPRRQFGFVSLQSADANSGQTSRDIRVFASGKSTNSGYDFDPDGVNFNRATGVVAGVRSAGQSPIVFERLEFTLEFPKSVSRFSRFDFNLREYKTTGDGNYLSVGANEPFFTGVIVE